MTSSTTISATAVATARDLYNQGQYGQAWEALAQAGDRYADNAAGVVGPSKDGGDLFFKTLVQHYWENTVGAETYQQKFTEVAGKHLNNYLTELERNDGLKPDTQFIIDSYEDALGRSGVSTNAAFDGAWAKAMPDDVLDSTWAVPFLGMEPFRMGTSATNNTLTPEQAQQMIFTAMGEALLDIGLSGRQKDFVDSMAKRFGDGVTDYWGDLVDKLGQSFDPTLTASIQNITDMPWPTISGYGYNFPNVAGAGHGTVNPAPIDIPTDTPTRISSDYVTDNGAGSHSVTVTQANGTVWDMYKVQTNSPTRGRWAHETGFTGVN